MIKYRDRDGEIRFTKGNLFTGIFDSHGSEICEGDTLRFFDKAEWYKSDLIKLGFEGKSNQEALRWLNAQPYEERVVELPQVYEWLLSSEIQTYWEIATEGKPK